MCWLSCKPFAEGPAASLPKRVLFLTLFFNIVFDNYVSKKCWKRVENNVNFLSWFFIWGVPWISTTTKASKRVEFRLKAFQEEMHTFKPHSGKYWTSKYNCSQVYLFIFIIVSRVNWKVSPKRNFLVNSCWTHMELLLNSKINKTKQNYKAQRPADKNILNKQEHQTKVR